VINQNNFISATVLFLIISLPLYLVTRSFYSYEKDVVYDEIMHSGECIYGDCDNGYGVYELEDGSKFVGDFENDKLIFWLFLSDEFQAGNVSFYLKAHSVEITDEYLYAEDMSDLKEIDNAFNAKSIINYVEINCDQSNARPLKIDMYSLPLGQGEVVATSQTYSDLTFDFVDFSENERGAVYEVLCEQAQNQKMNPSSNYVFKEAE